MQDPELEEGDFCYFFGVGDHGGGPTKSEIDYLQEQRKKYDTIANTYKASNGTPIFRQRTRYFLSNSKGKPHAAQATIFQFPIKVAFAITGHKMQVILNFHKQTLSNWYLYSSANVGLINANCK